MTRAWRCQACQDCRQGQIQIVLSLIETRLFLLFKNGIGFLMAYDVTFMKLPPARFVA
jgi:hypothetical protein